MARTLLIASLLALNIAPARAERLSNLEQAFVVTTAVTAEVVAFCDVKVITDGVPKLADRLGVDDKIIPAVRAAFQVYADLPYERSDLIPAVTQLFRAASLEVERDLQANKKRACAKWIEQARKVGTVE